jgi:hypothetical protein
MFLAFKYLTQNVFFLFLLSMDWLDSDDSDLEFGFMAAVIQPQRGRKRRRKPTQRKVIQKVGTVLQNVSALVWVLKVFASIRRSGVQIFT